MTSKIYIYHTNIVPERNALVDDIEDYLTHNCINTYTNEAFQYIQLGLDIKIKVPLKQSTLANQSAGNYVKIVEDNKIWYFFIIGAEWISQDAIQLSLSIDSINTFKDELQWSDKTLIYRQHKDRFLNVVAPNGEYYFRSIDDEDEGLSPSLYHNKPGEDIEANTFPCNWYLLYKTRDDLKPTDYNNPISCYVCPDAEIPVAKGETKPTREASLLEYGYKEYYFYPTQTGYLPEVEFYDYVKKTWNPFTVRENQVIALIYSMDLGGQGGNPLYTAFVGTKKSDGSYSYGPTGLAITRFRYKKVHYVAATKQQSTNGKPFLNAYDDLIVADKIDIKAGPQPDVLIYRYEEIDRTQSRNMKIIQLPYAPVSLNLGSDGLLVYPRGNYRTEDVKISDVQTRKALKLINLDHDLTNSLPNIELPEFLPKLYPTETDLRNDEAESKMYNSSFYQVKIVYDSFAKVIPLENLKLYVGKTTLPDPIYTPYLKVNFKSSNTINSCFAFQFIPLMNGPRNRVYWNEAEDYDKYLIVRRNNEMPLYNNNYVDYIRNGYNFDKKAHSIDLAHSVVNAGLSTIASIGHFGLGHYGSLVQKTSSKTGKPIKSKNPTQAGITGSLFGLSLATQGTSQFTDAIFGVADYQNSMASKLQQLSSQSSGVSGSDDVDLLNYYNHNRLQVFRYEPKEHAKAALLDLFFYTGYACQRRDLPNTTSRIWFNFIQCEPVFLNEETWVFNNYLEDIKERYRKGITVYHHRPNTSIQWDWAQTHENWETFMI